MLIDNSLKEPTLIDVTPYNDDRGMLVPFTDNVNPSLINRSYFVQNYGRHVIRGLHYHLNEFKLFTIAYGAAKFVTCSLPVDLASDNNNDVIKKYVKDNPNSLKTWVISSRCQKLLAIPRHHANGWIGLEDNTTLFSLSNLTYEQIKGDDIRIDPYVLDSKVWSVEAR